MFKLGRSGRTLTACGELPLHAGGDAGGDVAVGRAEDEDEAVGERDAGARDGEFVGPFELFGQVVRAGGGTWQDGIDGEIFRLDVVDGTKLDAALPIQIEVQRAHEGAREIGARGGVRELDGAGMVVDDEGEEDLIGELRESFSAAAENGVGIVAINAFEIVEEIGGGDAAGDAEAWAVGQRAVGDEDDPAVVVPDGFVASGLRRSGGGQAGEQRGQSDAGQYVSPKAHLRCPDEEEFNSLGCEGGRLMGRETGVRNWSQETEAWCSNEPTTPCLWI